MGGWRRRSVVGSAIGVVVCAAGFGLAGVADSSGDEAPPPEVSRGWQRTDAWPHPDVVAYDNVAVGSGLNTVAWFTRRGHGDVDAVAYREIKDGDDAVELDLQTPDTGVVIPVAVAIELDRWTAVAVSRDTAEGPNTGLMAWTGGSLDGGPISTGSALQLPAASITADEPLAPKTVSAAQLGETSVVTAVVNHRALVWRSTDAGASWSSPSLAGGADDALVSVKMASDGERLVLAGVEAAGPAHLWTSTDGESWDETTTARLPDDVGSVGLLAVLEPGRVAVGWLDDEPSAPFNATSMVVQVLDGDGLSQEGRITARDTGSQRVDPSGASLSPSGRLVVVGAALRANGTATPMVWVRDRNRWQPTEQAELVARFDYQFRAVATTRDGRMIGLVSALNHIDMESWLWQPDG